MSGQVWAVESVEHQTGCNYVVQLTFIHIDFQIQLDE